MRGLIGLSALALAIAVGAADAQTPPSPTNTPAQETAKQPGAPNAPGQVQGGQGNPTPDQSIGPPNAGPVALRGDGLRGDGLEVPGATEQTAPAKFSQHNADLDGYSIMGYPVQLDDKQRQSIWQAVGKTGETKSADGKTIVEEPGTFLPPLVQGSEFPEGLNKEIPLLRGLKYVKVDDKVLIVQPSNGIVRGVIEE